MKIVSFTGVVFFLLYVTLVDQVFDYISLPYKSPISYIPASVTGSQYAEPAIQIFGGIAVLLLAAVLTRVTPNLF